MRDERPDAASARENDEDAATCCPVCGAPTRQEKCKVVCRSERCVYRIVYNCSEF